MKFLMVLTARATLFGLGLGLIFAVPSYAYIDPVSGSFLVQSLIGGVAALIASMRTVRVKIWSFFRKEKSDEKVNPTKNEN